MDKIYIVTADGHGDVSWWTNEDSALEEVERIVRSTLSDEEIEEQIEQCKQYDPNRKDYSFLWCFGDLVCLREEYLDKSWV